MVDINTTLKLERKGLGDTPKIILSVFLGGNYRGAKEHDKNIYFNNTSMQLCP